MSTNLSDAECAELTQVDPTSGVLQETRPPAAPKPPREQEATLAAATPCQMNSAGWAQRLLPLIGVIVGFGLATGYDAWKRNHDGWVEAHRAARSIVQEVNFDLGYLERAALLLDQDEKVADENKEVVEPLEPLFTAAGQAAFIKGSLDYVSTALTENVGRVYTNLYFLNTRIQGREMYRATNGAMGNFAAQRKIWDADLSKMIESIRPELQSLKADLENSL
jgi:hypothetical protein